MELRDAQPLELWQVWADGYLAAQDGHAETTNPYAETCPTCGGYGMVMDWGGAADCPNDCWHGMVPAEPCDTAPFALDKIRERILIYREQMPPRYVTPPPIANLLDDLQAILDTTQETHHD